MKDAFSLIDKCPITDSGQHFTCFDLGDFPLVNNLFDTKEESINCAKFPLKVNYFTESGLSALSHAVDGDILFKNYLYKSAVNFPYITHCREMFKFVEEIVDLKDNDLIVDIGGNDGTLLASFKEESSGTYQYLNVDPSENLASLSVSKGVPVLTEFFSGSTPSKIGKKAKVITSTNVFQHLKDTNSFADGVKNLLADDGVWVLQFPYWIDTMKTNQFDQIYHEHMYYYTISSLKKLVEKHGLKIINVSKHSIHGGSMRLVMALEESKYSSSRMVDFYLEEELAYDENYYKKWGNGVNSHIEKCKAIISKLKKEGKSIAGFGAAAKGCVFLNAAGLTYQDIDFVIDDTDVKQGKYVPGTGIPIYNRSILKDRKVDYILILAHNFADYIIESLRSEYEGKFLVFLPAIREVSFAELA